MSHKDASPLQGKYGDVLAPFVAMMDKELHANAGKGDRPGWLAMSRETALLEIFYHLAKLQKAALNHDTHHIREFAADVANMSMMLVDVCGALTPPRCSAPGCNCASWLTSGCAWAGALAMSCAETQP